MTRRGVPAAAILASSVIGFLGVIASAFSPDFIFKFLLDSSGAVILFVYLLIAVSQIVLRYRASADTLKVKMWLFPVLSILTATAIFAILVQMFVQGGDNRTALTMSLLSWAVVIVLFVANRWFISHRPEVAGVSPEAGAAHPHRVLVLANQTVESTELLDELRRIGADRDTVYQVVVPASPIDTGVAATHGPLDISEATTRAAQNRLDQTLNTLRSEQLQADGELGDYRPLRALAHAVDTFRPDQIVISTLPPEDSVWHRFDVVDRARADYQIPVTHVVSRVRTEEHAS